MKELVKSIPKINLDQAKGFILLDTCFVINALEHHKHLDKLLDKKIGMTSFNIEELLKVEHRLKQEDKKAIRKTLKHPFFSIIEIPVHPGNWEEEKSFVNTIEPNLLKEINDPSDAVLIAVAIKTMAPVILTKDKHHLFTVKLEDYLEKYRIKVYKDLNFL